MIDGMTPEQRSNLTRDELNRIDDREEWKEYLKRQAILQLSPDPYGEHGIPIWHQPLETARPLTASDIESLSRTVTITPILDNRPRYHLHPRVHAVIVGLLALKGSAALRMIRPDIYEGWTYLTPEGVLVDVPALRDMAYIKNTITLDIPDGDGGETTEVYELNYEGERLANRLRTLSLLFDGSEPYEHTDTNTE